MAACTTEHNRRRLQRGGITKDSEVIAVPPTADMRPVPPTELWTLREKVETVQDASKRYGIPTIWAIYRGLTMSPLAQRPYCAVVGMRLSEPFAQFIPLAQRGTSPTHAMGAASAPDDPHFGTRSQACTGTVLSWKGVRGVYCLEIPTGDD